MAGVLLMTIGVPIAGAIGAMAPGVGGLMALSAFLYGWWLLFTSFRVVGRVIVVTVTVVVLVVAAVALIDALRAYQ